MQTFQQHLAETAYTDVLKVKGEPEAYRKKYATMAHKLPMLIHTAGLAQAIVFVQARGHSAQTDLLDQVAGAIRIPDISNGSDFAQRSREASLSDYMLLTRRTLDALLWYKRFVESILKLLPGDGDDDPGDVDDVDTVIDKTSEEVAA